MNLTKNNLNNHCMDIHGLVVCKYCGIHISSVEKWLYEHLKLNHNFKTIISDYFENTLFTIINEEVTCSLCGDILTSLMDNLEKVIYHYLSYHKLSLNSIGNLLIQNPSMEFNQTVCQIENIKLEANDVEIETANNEGCLKSLEQKEKNCLCEEKVSDSPMKEDQTDENEINENISEKSFQSNFDMISDVVDYKIDGYNDINFSEVQCIFSDTSDDAMSDNETLNNKESQNIDKHDCRNKTNTLSESNSSIVLKSLCIKCEVCLSNFDKKHKYIKHLERLHGFKCSNNNESVSDKAVRLNSKYVTVVKKYKNPLYLCLICKTETRSKMLARKHIRSHDFWISEICDSSDIGYKCYFCNDLFWTIENRNVHQIEKHLSLDESIKFMKCYLCTTIFSSKTCLKRHVQVEHESKEEFTSTSYKCMHCHMLYPNLNQIRKHFKDDHPGSKSLYCSFSTCRTKCSSKKVLKNHFKNLHLTQKSSQPQNCEICGKFFKNLRCKQLHVKMKHLNSIKTGFKCRVCDERFETDEKRKEHMEAFHPGVATFFCQYCNKGFRSKSGLSSHRQTHSDLNLICPHCQKSFSRRDSYIEHMLIHNGPRHRCDQCGREFVQRSNLVRHKRIHSGIKPYFCQYCYRGFADKSACSSHERVHTREEVCACPYCNRTFSKKQKLKYHIRIHTGEGLLTCTVCQKTFTSSYSMKKHMETHSRRAISNGKYNKKELERHSDS
ncbi:zinc finger protein 93-like [Ctenocephalides felis]|uniref:zinc finger protein 93-like n=1 Tax=Ctenocephalides felis TaxID=7515 RepID=UPI000E6E597B|nr:zinc finger protein 93-like [Ctenocephalides felis]